MNIKTSDLIGPALDWAVAKCEGERYSHDTTYNGIGQEFPPTNYSTDWARGGPIIEREKLCVVPQFPSGWAATTDNAKDPIETGPTPLIAALRCYVASKLGDKVEIPEELL